MSSLIEYVRCEDCNAQVPVSEAVAASSEYTSYYFCSESCFEDYNYTAMAEGEPELERYR